jgi:2-succinyl-5-enolpyruvyl-6-hydroxy-3-cyclohexene-1-carboxylate synthase
MHYGTITFKNFKIILINNGGGGIFRILPGHKETPVLIPSLKLPIV